MNTPIAMRRAVAASLILLALTLLSGCGSDRSDESSSATAAATRTYVGTAQGTAAFVAVVVDGTRALAYVCDGLPANPTGTVPSVQAWFNGPSDGKTMDLKQPAGRLQLRLIDAEMTGTVTLTDGREVTVTGRLVTGDAGLYRAEAEGSGSKAVAGWILAADGQQRGGVGGEGSLSKLSGARLLDLAQPTFSLPGLATSRIAKVGITPIPIP